MSTLPAGAHEHGGRLSLNGEALGGGRVCAFDGFLDNLADLRRELGEGDTAEEVVLGCWRRWGDGFPARLRGDFSLLVWDGARRRGLLARDQLGTRPLFFARTAGTTRFAGELRDLLDSLPSAPGPDPAAVAHLVVLENRPGRTTLYQGVERLLPGEALVLDAVGSRVVRYWEPRFEAPLEVDGDELAARVRASLEASVERRLAPAGETGVTLSGGLDSSSIAALAPRPLVACSAVFPDHEAADERELIEELRRSLGVGGPVAEVRAGGLLARSLEFLANWRLPQGGWGDFWQLPLMRAAAAGGVATMLGGDGGDELFAPRLYALADELRGGHPLRMLALARRLPGAGPHVGRREEARVIGRLGVLGALPRMPGVRATMTRNEPRAWLRRDAARALDSSAEVEAWRRLDGPRWWANIAHGVVYGIERAGVCEHVRRIAADAGLEARHPMLDLELVELALRQPPAATLDPRFTRPVLRRAVAGLLPDSVRLRPAKANFQSLIVSSLAGPDGRAVQELLTDPAARLGEYLDMGWVTATLYGSAGGIDENPFRWMWQVWRLFNIELWLRSLESEIPAKSSFREPEESRFALL